MPPRSEPPEKDYRRYRITGFSDQHTWRGRTCEPPRPPTAPAGSPRHRPAHPGRPGSVRRVHRSRGPGPRAGGRGSGRRVSQRPPPGPAGGGAAGGAADRMERATRPVACPASAPEPGSHLKVLLETDGEDLRHGGRGAETAVAAAVAVAVAPLTRADGRRRRRRPRRRTAPGRVPHQVLSTRTLRGIPPPAARGSAKSSPARSHTSGTRERGRVCAAPGQVCSGRWRGPGLIPSWCPGQVCAGRWRGSGLNPWSVPGAGLSGNVDPVGGYSLRMPRTGVRGKVDRVSGRSARDKCARTGTRRGLPSASFLRDRVFRRGKPSSGNVLGVAGSRGSSTSNSGQLSSGTLFFIQAQMCQKHRERSVGSMCADECLHKAQPALL